MLKPYLVFQNYDLTLPIIAILTSFSDHFNYVLLARVRVEVGRMPDGFHP